MIESDIPKNFSEGKVMDCMISKADGSRSLDSVHVISNKTFSLRSIDVREIVFSDKGKKVIAWVREPWQALDIDGRVNVFIHNEYQDANLQEVCRRTVRKAFLDHYEIDEASLIRYALTWIDTDPHLWDRAECQTCEQIGFIVGYDFGCEKRRGKDR